VGLYVLLNYLKQDILKSLSQHCHWGKRDKTPTNKATLAKKIQDAMEEDSPSKFLMHCTTKILHEMLKYCEVEIPDSKDKCVEAILSLADEMGLERFFTSFPQSKLKEFIASCNLRIDSESLDTMLASLMEQESIKAPFKSDEEPSKNKPDEIDEDISVIDLHHHFYREDLAFWLKEKKLNCNGSKKELVDRIRRHFDDKLLERDLLGPNKKNRKKTLETVETTEDPKSKKAKQEETPSEDKPEKSEKPEKTEKLEKPEKSDKSRKTHNSVLKTKDE